MTERCRLSVFTIVCRGDHWSPKTEYQIRGNREKITDGKYGTSRSQFTAIGTLDNPQNTHHTKNGTEMFRFFTETNGTKLNYLTSK